MIVRWNVKPDNDGKEGLFDLDYRVKPDNDRGGRMTVGADVRGELNNYKKTQVVPAFF